jgi:hypothetical protein
MDVNYKKIDVRTTPLTLTTTLADLGSEINCLGYKTLCVYVQLDINAANDITFAALGKLTEGATEEYFLPVVATGTAEYNIDKSSYEINYDADGYQMFRIDVEGVPFVQLQAKEGTDGGADADVEHCYAILV